MRPTDVMRLDEFPRRGNHASRMELEKQNREANIFLAGDRDRGKPLVSAAKVRQVDRHKPGLALHPRTTIGVGRSWRSGVADQRFQKQDEFLSKHESFLDCLLLVCRLWIWSDQVLHEVAFSDSAGVVAKSRATLRDPLGFRSFCKLAPGPGRPPCAPA
jgi:hypothetical protein